MGILYNNVSKTFENKFDQSPLLIRSPGRVNLIGEHTDYNEGFVLPAAIDKVIVFALAPSKDSNAHLYSYDMDEMFTFDVDDRPYSKSDTAWPNYIMGAVDQLKKAGYDVGGFNCVFGGNIPIGAGLSSSAAVEGGLLFGLSRLFKLDVDKIDLVKMGQRTENEFVGVQCGIMDQFINIFGKNNNVLKLDCRSLDFEHYPFGRDDVQIVLCDTKVRRELASSEYNKRRRQCEEGVEILKKHYDEVRSLRDATIPMLEEHQDEFDPIVFKRCRYVVEENNRVLKSCEDLMEQRFKEFGQRMYASHRGLRDDYEVSIEELDILVDEASRFEGVLGARMMGAGFGGCTINLVEEDEVSVFTDQIARRYKDRTGGEIEIYRTCMDAGTEIWNDEQVNSLG